MPLELQQIKAEKEALEAEKKESEKKAKEAHDKEKEKEAAALAARQQRQAEHQEPRFHKLFFSEWHFQPCVIGLGSSRYAFGVPRLEIPLALFRQTILTQEEVQGRSNANGLMMSWDVAQEGVGQLRLSIYYIKRKR